MKKNTLLSILIVLIIIYLLFKDRVDSFLGIKKKKSETIDGKVKEPSIVNELDAEAAEKELDQIIDYNSNAEAINPTHSNTQYSGRKGPLQFHNNVNVRITEDAWMNPDINYKNPTGGLWNYIGTHPSTEYLTYIGTDKSNAYLNYIGVNPKNGHLNYIGVNPKSDYLNMSGEEISVSEIIPIEFESPDITESIVKRTLRESKIERLPKDSQDYIRAKVLMNALNKYGDSLEAKLDRRDNLTDKQRRRLAAHFIDKKAKELKEQNKNYQKNPSAENKARGLTIAKKAGLKLGKILHNVKGKKIAEKSTLFRRKASGSMNETPSTHRSERLKRDIFEEIHALAVEFDGVVKSGLNNMRKRLQIARIKNKIGLMLPHLNRKDREEAIRTYKLDRLGYGKPHPAKI